MKTVFDAHINIEQTKYICNICMGIKITSLSYQ